MRKNLVTIDGAKFAVKEFKNQRVVTVKDIAQLHQIESKTITQSFYRNKKRFIEGSDFFKLKGKKAVSTICSNASKMITEINIFTESGYLMLVKSLTDDLSWQVQRELVNGYFKAATRPSTEHGMTQARGTRSKPNPLQVLAVYPLLAEDYKKLLYYRMEKGLTQEETALVMKMSCSALGKREQALKTAGLMIPRIHNNHGKYKLSLLDSVQKVLDLEG